MTWQEWGIVAAIAGVMLNFAKTAYDAVFKYARMEGRLDSLEGAVENVNATGCDNADTLADIKLKLAVIDDHVNTMWDFQLRRGFVEAIQRGAAKKNSPVVLTEQAEDWMTELAGKLRAFYRTLGRNLTERELAFEIEKNYGQEIAEKVCIPNGLTQGACLWLATRIAAKTLEEG